jgi:hypothetical protein
MGNAGERWGTLGITGAVREVEEMHPTRHSEDAATRDMVSMQVIAAARGGGPL